ncbi:MAG: Dam family site-specific DNA-(adenine-N6)-methyltransferase [Leptotrichiaceae bacterium]|nr:Dam family site-specific DNA-(adenine-N6)-methyltransferase [Leptotrichiaceae bacterium]MBP9630576.1 Dam family site-specific DNA-(adenine-N6)-methyltransferase [Leptotrichiaceae bacterium]
MEFIKSPINYTGNKYRILDQITKYFPKKVDTFVDLFSGGATVGFNVNAKKIILIDSNEKIVNLLIYLASSEFELLVKELEKLIKKYNLSYSAKYGYEKYKLFIDGNNGLKKYNEIGFYSLREDYSNLKNKKTKKANSMLYLLTIYGFNNDMRFNKAGNFNLPVGKTDLNKNNIKKLKDFIKRSKRINYEFIIGDFRDNHIKKIVKEAGFVYIDPPYLITKATYNENGGWSEEKERELLGLLDEIDNNNGKFVISNILNKKNKINIPLNEWINTKKHKVVQIDYHYRSSSYNKKNRDGSEREIIVLNGDKHGNI